MANKRTRKFTIASEIAADRAFVSRLRDLVERQVACVTSPAGMYEIISAAQSVVSMGMTIDARERDAARE